MRKSKKLFFIVAAIIVLVVVFIIVLHPGGEVPGPTEPGSSSTPPTGPSIPGTTDTVPTWPTGPTVTPTVPTDPTDPSQGDPTEPTGPQPYPGPTKPTPQKEYRPKEEGWEDLPKSNGKHYGNYAPVQINMKNSWLDQTFLLTIGHVTGQTDDYLYLSPSVRLVDGNQTWSDRFQFVFIPSEGHVTTITEAALNDYSGDGYSTFVRAMDYGLPASYESEKNPGTVWYMSKSRTLKENEHIYIDVRVYYCGSMMASLRIYVRQDMEGTYKMAGITDLNQLVKDAFYLEARPDLQQEHEAALMALAKELAYAERTQYKHQGNGPASLTERDFIIEYREAGQGTYFDYICSPYNDRVLTARENLLETPIVAVTIRTNYRVFQPGPMTFYYRIVEGVPDEKGVIGETTYEMLGVDIADYYYLYSLYYGKYPGYSNRE